MRWLWLRFVRLRPILGPLMFGSILVWFGASAWVEINRNRSGSDQSRDRLHVFWLNDADYQSLTTATGTEWTSADGLMHVELATNPADRADPWGDQQIDTPDDRWHGLAMGATPDARWRILSRLGWPIALACLVGLIATWPLAGKAPAVAEL